MSNASQASTEVAIGTGEDRSGEVLSDRYELQERIGVGAMGSVYRAEHTLMKKTVAVKVLHPDLCRADDITERFAREAQAAAHLEHTNVCAATDFGYADDGSLFLVMEYLDGETLAERLEREDRLPVPQVLDIVRQVTSALVRAGELGIVHRDLKPDNIFLVGDGTDGVTVKILDFGIARVRLGEVVEEMPETAGTLTRAGMIVGTPSYIAPEQAAGEAIDPRADLYALGVVMYEMLAGHPPFEGKSALHVIGQHMNAEPPPLPSHVPDLVSEVVERLLAKSPDDRYRDAGELADVLENAESRQPELGNTASPLAQTASPLAETASPLEPDPQTGAGQPSSSSAVVFGEGDAAAVEAPVKRYKRIATIVGIVFLVWLGIGIGVAVFRDSEPDDDAASATGSDDDADGSDASRVIEISPPEKPKIPVAAREDVLDALTLLDDGHEDAGFARLQELEGELGERAEYWRLVHERAKQADRDELAARALAKRLQLDGSILSEPDVRESVEDTLSDRRDGETFVTALGTEFDERVAATLAELAIVARRSRARKRARQLLVEADRIDDLDTWLQRGIEVRSIPRWKCKDRRAIVEELVELGRPESVIVIDALRREPDDGCGMLDLEDCSRCMRGTLRDARETLVGDSE